MLFRFFRALPGGAGMLLLLAGIAHASDFAAAMAPGATLRAIAPDLLELEFVQVRPPAAAATELPWNLADHLAAVPAAAAFEVTAAGRRVAVREVGVKRRALYAPLRSRDLRVGTWIYLRLDSELADGTDVQVANPDGKLWPAATPLALRLDPLRTSPAIHVNEEGYVPGLPKKAMVGYYLGTAGEWPLAAGTAFRVVAANGATVFAGRLTPRPDAGFNYTPAPYQRVLEADFSPVAAPGRYRLVVPGIGASLPFQVDEGIALDFARAYALGIYHQRCGTDNALPYTRFTHEACHTAPASVPVPAADFPFTWSTLAQLAAEAPADARRTSPPLTTETAQLYPFVRRGPLDVSGGHHDAGDYSKYTTNSASFVHCLLFAVDSLPGGTIDNLGLPESGDGVPDLLQEAKWEADFLAKLQDDDGGFYFLVYPRDRAYEGNVLPDHGDPQVVWPKNTAATAAAVAALAQASSSPAFRRFYPREAKAYRERAERGWKFLLDAIARHGRDGAYQRLTHYGDNFRHDDELAWAACELFLATGDEAYHEKFRAWCDPASAENRRWGWWRLSESWGHAIRSYAFAARSGRLPAARLDRRWLERCEAEIEAAGRDALRWSEHSAYGTSFPEETKRMRGGGWYFSLDQAFDLAVASQLDYPRANDPRPQFLAAYLANLNYEAGCNPVNQSYITGLGQQGQREFVDQYARNDGRVLPRSGLPIGNLEAGQPYLDPYKGELGAMSYPEDGAAVAPYPYYDRWTDTYNIATEFVIVNQARALAGLAWLAGKTAVPRVAWRPVAGTIADLPAKAGVDGPLTARFTPPAGLRGAPVEITWEARDQEPARGATYTFTPHHHGRQWVEAEARWTDGRRVFARAEFVADNGRPVVTVTAPVPSATVADGRAAAVTFHRSGDTAAAALTIHFELKGTATKWNDYRRPEGDMPVDVVIPAGSDAVTMNLRAVAEGLGSSTRHLLLVLVPDDAYNLASPHAVIVTLVGAGSTHTPPAPALPPLPE